MNNYSNYSIDILSLHDLILYDSRKQDDDNFFYKELYTEIEENTSEDVLHDLKKKYNNKNEERYKFYLVMAIPIIDRYKDLKKKKEKISFIKTKFDESQKNKLFQELIEEYIEIVRNFFPNKYDFFINNNNMSTIKKEKNKIKQYKCTTCIVCNSSDDYFIISDNSITCSRCGNVIESTSDELISFKDIERINIGSKYSYDRKSHFRETIKRFMGKQNVNIPNQIFVKIVNQLKAYNLIPESYEYKSSCSQKKEIFKYVKREHICMILKDFKMSKYYEDTSLIYHQITNKEIPDISDLEASLVQDFDKLILQYDKTFKDNRKNFISTQYCLYALLSKHGYPCDRKNFSFLKTQDRKAYHDVIMSKLFMDLGWNFTPVF